MPFTIGLTTTFIAPSLSAFLCSFLHSFFPRPTLPCELGAHQLVLNSEFCFILSPLSISDSLSQFSHSHHPHLLFPLCFSIFLYKTCWDTESNKTNTHAIMNNVAKQKHLMCASRVALQQVPKT